MDQWEIIGWLVLLIGIFDFAIGLHSFKKGILVNEFSFIHLTSYKNRHPIGFKIYYVVWFTFAIIVIIFGIMILLDINPFSYF